MDELVEVAPVAVEFSAAAARAWALSISAWAVEVPEFVDEDAVFDVPDVVLAVVAEFVAAVVGVGLVVVPVDVWLVALFVLVPLLLDVVTEGTADNQSMVVLTPSMTADFEPATTVLLLEEDVLDAGDTESNSV